VTLATLWSSERERAEATQLQDYCDEVNAVRVPKWRSLFNCVRALPSSEPLQAVYSWSEALASQLLDLRDKADVVHVEHLRGARYGTFLTRGHQGSAVPVIWDAVDCISYLFEQAVARRHDQFGMLVNRLELPRTRRREASLPSYFDRVLISSEADKKEMLKLRRGWAARAESDRLIDVLPNGVDTGYFTPSSEARQPKTLVFSGKMSYHANVSAAIHLLADIMPLVWARQPDVRLVIAGKEPPRSVRALAARRPSCVTVTGTVQDIRPFVRQASVAVIPLVYGAGSQFKVLEAMACGTPVVATPRSVGVLTARPGHDLLVAEQPAAFAEAVIGLLESDQRREAIGSAGRSYVEAHHSWNHIAGQLEEIYLDAIARRRGTLPPSARIGADVASVRPVSPCAPFSPLVH
jgi:glycosyltransferase involved in cell wall biosynthesis